tara:strand:- start:188 stop:529 length:342 start_codon:yes stop_codon:yes gene_type:complete
MANSFINKKVDLTTTDLTTLYTVPSAKTSVIKSLLVSEDAGSGTTITVTLVDSSGAIFNLFKDKSIGSKVTTELLTQPFIMEESEVLKVQAADANELHVIASILEIQPREVTT